MTRSELKALVSYWLDDLQFGYFTETQVNVWLNNGLRELQKEVLQAAQMHYLRCVQTTLVVNQYDYVLPDDFLKLHRLEVVISGVQPNESLNPLAPITLNQKDLVNTTVGTSVAYYLKRNRLVLNPAPDTALTLRLYYSYLAPEMTLDTDVPDAPENLQEFIAILAAIDGFMKDGRDPSPFLVAKRDSFLALLKKEAQERLQDAPRGIIQTEWSAFDMGSWYW